MPDAESFAYLVPAASLSVTPADRCGGQGVPAILTARSPRLIYARTTCVNTDTRPVSAEGYGVLVVQFSIVAKRVFSHRQLLVTKLTVRVTWRQALFRRGESL
jgi:hypothetical protein